MDDSYYKKYEPIFGSWYIKKKLGAGSFGAVYEIEREDFGVIYKSALKTITIPADEAEIAAYRADGLSDAEINDELYQFTSELIAEFELMSKLKGNSHIVSYEDHQVIKHDDGIGWDILIRMELLTPLVEYIHNNPIRVSDVIKLGIDMCHALELCQKFNIIHRDIKPENIFISQNGDYKLGDFGIARQIEKTTFGLSKKGTYNYMAPEVYKGQKYGTGVDMYSLGIVLYRLLNQNRAPFMPPHPEKITHTKREQALIKRMSGEELPPPKSLSEGRLVEIIIKAAAYDPEDRYSSPVQMREDLSSIQYDYSEYVLFNPRGDKLEINSENYAETDTAEAQTEIIHGSGDESVTEVMSSPKSKRNRDRKRRAADISKSERTGKIKGVHDNSKKKIIAAIAAAVCVFAGVNFAVKHFLNKENAIITKQEETSVEIALDENKSIKELASEISFYSNTQYSSEDETIVKIDEDGMVTPVAEGKTKIKCLSDTDANDKIDLEGNINITVIISKAEQESVNKSKKELNVKYEEADAVLQKAKGDSSIDQNNINYERDALEKHLNNLKEKIDGTKRSAEAEEAEEYYNSKVLPAIQKLEKAYNIAYTIAHPAVVQSSSSSSKNTATKSGGTSANTSNGGVSTKSYNGSSSTKNSSSGTYSGGSVTKSTNSGGAASGGNSQASGSSSSSAASSGGAPSSGSSSSGGSSNSAPDIFLDF